MPGKIFGVGFGGRGLEALEIGEECLPDVAAQGEVGVLAFAFDVDETGGFEFVEMVRERGSGDGQAFAHVATGCASGTGAQPLDDFHAAGVAEGFEDGQALAGRESCDFCPVL
jgi:hypothetical protein